MDIRSRVVTRIPLFAVAFLSKILPWKRIRFRKIPGFVLAADLLLAPLMKLGAEGKITHWWDWEPVSRSEIDPEIRPLLVESGTPQQRVYKISKWLGQYNLEGIRDVHKTLFSLQVVVVLEPELRRGYWRLLISGNRYQDEKQYELYDRVDLLVLGKVKTLLDGKKWFLGQAEDGKYVALRQVEITTRDQYPDMPFV